MQNLDGDEVADDWARVTSWFNFRRKRALSSDYRVLIVIDCLFISMLNATDLSLNPPDAHLLTSTPSTPHQRLPTPLVVPPLLGVPSCALPF